MSTLEVFEVNAVTGKAAIYTIDSSNPTDTAPLATPKSFLSRVRFHSDFRYPKIIQDVTTTVTLAAVAQSGLRVTTYNLFAHGLAGTPVVFGAIFIANGTDTSGAWAPLTLSTPTIWSPAQPGEINDTQLLSLGANATHVRLSENTAQRLNVSTMPSVTLTVRVIVTDELI